MKNDRNKRKQRHACGSPGCAGGKGATPELFSGSTASSLLRPSAGSGGTIRERLRGLARELRAKVEGPGAVVSQRRFLRKWGKPALSRALLVSTMILMAAGNNWAQELPAGSSASDFSSVNYFDPPNQQQIKSRLSGAEVEPMSGGGGLVRIKELTIETFNLDGKPQFIASAPECVYDPLNGVANSPGELHLRTGDGQLRIDGQGFLWQQRDSFLTISNQIRTIVERTPAQAQ